MRRVILTLLFCLSGLHAQTNLTIEGLRNRTGNVCVIIFDKATGFPSDHTKAIHRERVPASRAKNGVLKITLQKKSLKNVAFVVLHDENSNNKLDRNFLKIPQEGIAMSNGVTIPPKFQKARVKGPVKNLRLKVKYW